MVPPVSIWIERVLDCVIFIILPLLLVYLFLKKWEGFSRKAKIGIIAVFIIAFTINGFMFFVLSFGRALFGQEVIFEIVVPGANGVFQISRVSGIPEGENFILYQISNGIFRKRIAHSYRWHKEYQDPFVELYSMSEGRKSEPIYIYDVERHHLELYKP
jgi:hypothetical protein